MKPESIASEYYFWCRRSHCLSKKRQKSRKMLECLSLPKSLHIKVNDSEFVDQNTSWKFWTEACLCRLGVIFFNSVCSNCVEAQSRLQSNCQTGRDCQLGLCVKLTDFLCAKFSKYIIAMFISLHCFILKIINNF